MWRAKNSFLVTFLIVATLFSKEIYPQIVEVCIDPGHGGEYPACMDEGDCAIPLNGQIMVDDVTWLVDYLFRGGSPPPDC